MLLRFDGGLRRPISFINSSHLAYLGFAIVLFAFLGQRAIASDYGTTGLIDIPTARMQSDGTLTASMAFESRTESYMLTYQATPWLEGTFRYTGFNDFFFWDRNYEVKARLWEEQWLLPQVAVGIRDAVGTGVFGSEYVVASKQLGNLDVTLGLGWGRLADKGVATNPLTYIDDRFKRRTRSDDGTGGEVNFDTFFGGEEVGLFGGASYDFERWPLKAIIEYNPDQYAFDAARGVAAPPSPWTFGLAWQALPGVELTVSRQHDEAWGLALTARIDTTAEPPKRQVEVFVSSANMAPDELPQGFNSNSWYDRLLYDMERSGLLLIEARIDTLTHAAVLIIGNDGYALWADAAAKAMALVDLYLPPSVRSLQLVIEENGHRVHTLSALRPSSSYWQGTAIAKRNLQVLPGRSITNPQHRTNFVTRKVNFDINLNNRVQLFDPDTPLRYQVYLELGAEVALPLDWTLRGSYAFDIYNTFGESTRQSDSVLPRVRSDIVKYLQEGESGLDSLYLENRGSVSPGLHYRVFGGILEEMYSGIGGELLYQPYQSRLAFGASANWVRQRDFDKSFKHLDYETTTAFLSAYWATPFYNYDVAVHAGRYLAKDLGATVELRRTFTNGWMVGLWATLTDVSPEDFGEGSFDKGIFFRIPLDGLFGNNTRSAYTTRMRPIQRDGGQRLENHSGNIWWDLRSARFDVFARAGDRISP